MRIVLKLVIGLWKWAVGVAACMTLPSSVLVVGWVLRAMRRKTLSVWNQYSEASEKVDVGDWPNWVLRNRGEEGWWPASLWQNIKIGLQGTFNIFVLTLPAGAMWAFAWRFGWDNSFHKVYEQAWMGPTMGLSGVALFIAAMFYAPLAQARQAVTGDWRSFYDFHLVWRLARRLKWACVRLAALYAAVSVPIVILRFLPVGQFNLVLDYRSDEELVAMLNKYYLAVSVLLFPLYLWVRLSAAKIYARAMLETVALGTVQPQELAIVEQQTLGKLGLLQPADRPRRHILIRTTGWTASRLAGFTAGALAAALWFAFVAQIYIGEFLNHHPLIGWLNQPLIQLPVVRYIPSHLTGQ